MNKNRFAKQVTVAAWVILLIAGLGLGRAQGVPSGAVQTPRAASSGMHPKTDSPPQDDFAGLNYTDEQKAAIDRIHRDTESQKAAVAKDEKLTADQKDSMLLGYTRIEYFRIFKVLTPEQQKQVRERMHARKEADQAEKRQQPPRN